jgi:hypothetical protein
MTTMLRIRWSEFSTAKIKQNLDIAMETPNGAKFKGITGQETNHDISNNCLGFDKFSFFNGVRMEYKSLTVIIFLFKPDMDLDNFLHVCHLRVPNGYLSP